MMGARAEEKELVEEVGEETEEWNLCSNPRKSTKRRKYPVVATREHQNGGWEHFFNRGGNPFQV
jgi:hypothetical protein